VCEVEHAVEIGAGNRQQTIARAAGKDGASYVLVNRPHRATHGCWRDRSPSRDASQQIDAVVAEEFDGRSSISSIPCCRG